MKAPTQAPYIRSVRVSGFDAASRGAGADADVAWVEQLPVVKQLTMLGELPLPTPVTLLAGDNGMGKSTLLEAIAVLAGCNADGGSRHMRYSGLDDASPLHRAMGLVRRANPPDAFFLRAEGHLRMLEEIAKKPPIKPIYGPDALHHLSHGESVWAMVTHRFADGLYLLDEPESGLSPTRQMAMLARIRELADDGAQFIIATHSPILLAIPGATIYELTEDGIRITDWDRCDAVVGMREFFADVDGTVDYLTADEGP
ncbi:AAA family ATPase [uncultured Corynebacterium sp.]|uniref:AAA family ATPase n=1 Tax=uncultured Corynebacterium sp. TaxID=159447 RepID=UPI0025EEE49B|nr:AAA family ATPase [uncultured Corynebacterium sp.]